MNTVLARRQMVAQQIRPWDVFDANVLTAFGDVRRDQFVPDYCINAAYADAEIPLAHEQCMLRPSIVGKFVQALDIRRDDHVLEIGTGTGYLTACLARVAGKVTSIDIFDDFVIQATKNLARADVQNVSIRCMDAMKDLPEGRFDAIAVTGSMDEVDARLLAVLNPGGRLMVVVGESPAKSAILVRCGHDKRMESLDLFETDIPALLNRDRPAGFSF